ncbi:ankyrin repeat family protein [Rhynchospora pubera]|uniref:Ankyrin repeat family protein n=1 Tax=Rhynchospora pubera TaxID=906938 RepID=A0AAV8BP04_9POAL|nr:ankyrin repeat family protein [Rhynchospora pubera]
MARLLYQMKVRKFLEAASSGNISVLKEIVVELNGGKEISDKIRELKDVNGCTALHLGASRGRTEICQYLVQDLHFPVDLHTAKGETPLCHAAMQGHEVTARYLISQGANLVAPSREGSSPLHYAAKYGQDKMVKYLLSLGVPVDVTCNHAAGPPLIMAAACGQASTAEVLLQHHADVNCATSIDYSPLFVSVAAGSLECTKLCIKAGADVNFNCPLDMAIHVGSIEIIKCLLEAGANPNVRNECGWLPIERAVMSGKWDIVEMLFPLTSPVPEVHDWSVRGLIQYLNSINFIVKNEAISKKNIADLKVKGADSFKKKEYVNAIFFYSKAAVLDSGDAALFSNRSLCMHRLGDGELALKDAEMARRLRPEWPKAYYRVGAAYMLLENYEEAFGAFEYGLRLDPTNIEMKKAHWEALDCLRKSRFGF